MTKWTRLSMVYESQEFISDPRYGTVTMKKVKQNKTFKASPA